VPPWNIRREDGVRHSENFNCLLLALCADRNTDMEFTSSARSPFRKATLLYPFQRDFGVSLAGEGDIVDAGAKNRLNASSRSAVHGATANFGKFKRMAVQISD
jgi:hypothetical protein